MGSLPSPHFVIDASNLEAPARAAAWLQAQKERFGPHMTIGIGGPRESEAPSICAWAAKLIAAIIDGAVLTAVGERLLVRRLRAGLRTPARERCHTRQQPASATCQGLRTPATTTLPRAPTAGVGKAPMDEIARGGRRRCGGLYERLIGAPTLMRTDGTSRGEIDGAFKRVMPSPFWKQRAPHTTLGCWHRS